MALTTWFALTGLVLRIQGGDLRNHPWLYRYPEPFPVDPGIRGYDFMLNRTGIIWQWNLPQIRRIKKTEKDKAKGVLFEGEQFISMELYAPHGGWIGVGFCEPRPRSGPTEGSMQNCDLIIAWVDQATGKGYACDYWSFGNGPPVVDLEQDVRLISAVSSNGNTLITIERDMVTDDDLDVSFWDPIVMIWANQNNSKLMNEANGTSCEVPRHSWDMAKCFDEYPIYLWKALKRREDPFIPTTTEEPHVLYDYSGENTHWIYGGVERVYLNQNLFKIYILFTTVSIFTCICSNSH